MDPSTGSGQGGTTRVGTQRTGNDADDSTPAQKYFVEDHLGNCSVTVQTNGARINMEETQVMHSWELCIAKDPREAHPFGQTSCGSFAKKRYRYNGKEKDEHSGLYNYGARYYAPWLCRFVSVDPIAEDYPQLSSYNYAGNKPITSPDIEGLQSAVDSSDTASQSKKPTSSGRTYRDPAGNTFRATGVHNVATAKGADEVLTSAGITVGTRTDALLQFDFKGENYKAHFSAETLDFTAYKTAEGKEFPIEYSAGEYSADIRINIDEKSDGMMTFHAVVTGNSDWHFNNSEFSFQFPIDIDTNFGVDFSNDLPEVPLEAELMQVELTGKIYFSDLDTDLRELVGGLRFEFVESTIEMNHGYISAESGITGFKAMNESYKKIIGATMISFKFGLRGKGRRQEFIEALENVNPSPVNIKASNGGMDNIQFYNIPAVTDSIAKGLKPFK